MLKPHTCPTCGKQTSGSYSEGGLLWAICEDCMSAQREANEQQRRGDEARQFIQQELAAIRSGKYKLGPQKECHE